MSNVTRRRPPLLTPEERKSVTHGAFWIPEAERAVYKRALEALNTAGVPYVVAGAYAIYEHTGIYRKTKDLDLFFEPAVVVAAARALRAAGFVTRLEDRHWLAKATMGEYFVDLIYGMGNGVARIDEDWIRHSHPSILAACPVRIAPPEELIWHRLFISERHRHDMSDIVHLILCHGQTPRLGADRGAGGRQLAPAPGAGPDVQLRLPRLPHKHPELGPGAPARAGPRTNRQRRRRDPISRGARSSPVSASPSTSASGDSSIPRDELVHNARQLPEIKAIAEADVWDARAEDRADAGDEFPA